MIKKYLPIALSAAVAVPYSGNALSESIEEIVVTARKMEENIQEVPLAITALSGANLERAGVQDFRDITNMVAGLQFDGLPGKSYVTPTIRGVSQVSRSDDENNTSIFIDGVYVSGRDGLDFSMLDLERVEVVKGPQGALYGRNSYAGAINFITKKPSDEFQMRVSGTAGNFEKQRAGATVSGPLIPEVLAGRIAVSHDEFSGGYENPLNNESLGGYNSNFINGALSFTPTDNVSVDLNTYISKDDIDTPAQSVIAGNCVAATSPIFPYEFSQYQYYCGEIPSIDPDDEEYFTYDENSPGTRRYIARTSLTATIDFENTALTSISGYNTLKTDGATDQDRQLSGSNFYTTLADPSYVTLPTWVSFGNSRRSEWSQEFRFQSTGENRLQWLVGTSYYAMDSQTRGWYGVDTSPLPEGVEVSDVIAYIPTIDLSDGFDDNLYSMLDPLNDTKQTTDTFAVYGSLSFDVTDKLTIRGEARYSKEEKTLKDDIAGRDQSDTWTTVTPRFTMDYQMTDNALLYSSVAQGTKAGGFNTPNDDLPVEYETYDEESNWTYEVGAKTDWLDQSLRVNVAVFYIDMEDVQITNQVPNTTAFAVLNAGTAESKGFELEVSAAPTENLDINFGYALADSSFVDADDESLRTLVGVLLDSTDVSGQQLPRTSKHTVNGSLQYTQYVMEGLEGYFRIDGRYESEQKGDTHDAMSSIGSRFIANARIGVTGDNWDVSLWSNNLLDDDTPVIASSTLLLGDYSRLPVAGLPTPRTYGLSFSYDF